MRNDRSRTLHIILVDFAGSPDTLMILITSGWPPCPPPCPPPYPPPWPPPWPCSSTILIIFAGPPPPPPCQPPPPEIIKIGFLGKHCKMNSRFQWKFTICAMKNLYNFDRTNSNRCMVMKHWSNTKKNIWRIILLIKQSLAWKQRKDTNYFLTINPWNLGNWFEIFP